MSATRPNPADEGQLTSSDPGGYRSCVAYSFAYACGNASNGTFHPSGRQIRVWTGDTSGGLELGQCERAVELRSTLNFVTTTLTRSQFYAKLAAGFGMVLLGGYGAINGTKYSGQPGFTGNHGIYVPPNKKAMDPLCDGRRPGVYKYHGETYPDWLLDLFAARLRLSNGVLAGAGHFEVSYVKVNATASLPSYRVRVDPGNLGLYPVNTTSRTVTGNPKNKKILPPQRTWNSSPPRTYSWPGHPTARLVRVSGGPLDGKHISVKNPRVHLEERP